MRKDARHDDVTEDLTGLREDVRGVVREVRDTLYDLRTDVSEDRDVESVLEEFAARIQERSGMQVVVRIDQTARLARLPERELWRGLAQTAVGVTHAQRGNRVGAARLLRRGAERVEPFGPNAPHGVDVAGVAGFARGLADDLDAGRATFGDGIDPSGMRLRTS